MSSRDKATVESLTRPRPRDVPGYAEAAAAGLLPSPQAEPPTLTGPTARSALLLLSAVVVVSVVAAVGTVLLMPTPDGQMAPATAVAVVVVLAVGGAASWAVLRSVRRRMLAELQAGYTTHTFEQGHFWMSGSGIAGDVVGWDWRGTWVLDGDGSPRSAPDRDVDPPGMYPSPHEPGRMELWTGYRWTKFYDG